MGRTDEGEVWSSQYEDDLALANHVFTPRRSLLAVGAVTVLILVTAAGVLALRWDMEREELGCQATPDGIEYRRASGFEPDQGRPEEVVVGQRYLASSGCLPCDSTLRYDYRWFVQQRVTVIPDDAC